MCSIMIVAYFMSEFYSGLKLMHTLENIQQPSLLAVQSHSDSQLLTDDRLEGLELMHTLDAKLISITAI